MKQLQRFLLIAFGFSFLPQISMALPETSMPEAFETVALPYFESGKAGTMTTKDKLKIRYRVFEASQSPAKGIIVVSTGRKEMARKYAELAYDFRNSGYKMYFYDHRGQGESSRMIKDPLKGYVRHFQQYVDDLEQLIGEVVRPQKGEKLFILAHSMGGQAAVRYAIQNPGVVRAIVASSPMFEAKTGDYSQPVALTLLNGLILIGKGQDYARGRGPDDFAEPFEKGEVTTSRARHAYADRLVRRQYAQAIAGPTNMWVREAVLSGYWIKSRMTSLKTPLLLLQPEKEVVVNPEVQTELCKKTKFCKLSLMKGSLHEIFMEKDAIRDSAFNQALDFFARY